MSDINRPHVAVIDCRVEISVVNNTGTVSNLIVNPIILEEHGIKPSFLLSVTGKNLEECLENLKTKIGNFNNE